MSRAKKGKTGPESILTNDLVSKLKENIMDGKTLRETASIVGIPESTLYSWKSDNYQNIADKINTWETQRMLKQAEDFSKKLMAMPTVDENGKLDSRLVAIQQKESEFLREKLLIARDKYNSGNVVNVNVALPQPIIDLGKVVETVEPQKSLDKQGDATS